MVRQRRTKLAGFSLLLLLGSLLLPLAIVAAATEATNKGSVVVAGATGYIGKAVVRESVRQGYQTYALVRDKSKVESEEGKRLYGDCFEGATVVQVDVTNATHLAETLESIRRDGRIEAVVSCLASRSGSKREAYEIDYRATLNLLEAAVAARARHFVLLSAICVRRPLLHFQQAKLKMEAALQAQPEMTYSIVRPTAFMKSLSGQLERLQQGSAFLMFRETTKANPIAEPDLAAFMIDTISNESRHNRILNIGGPDEPKTKLEQGEMLFKAIGKEPSYLRVPVWIFDVIIAPLQWLADLLGSNKLENAAEIGRIVKYYATEDMVTTEPEEMHGTITLQEHFDRIAAQGQDYDPYTTTGGIIGLMAKEDLPQPVDDSSSCEAKEGSCSSSSNTTAPVAA